jgi:hypothetical protein
VNGWDTWQQPGRPVCVDHGTSWPCPRCGRSMPVDGFLVALGAILCAAVLGAVFAFVVDLI